MKGRYKYNKNKKLSLNWILLFILFITVVYAAGSATLYITGGGIVKAMPNSDYYYMNGYFYSSPESARASQGRIADKSVVDETADLTSMNQAISQIYEGKKIYMMSTYEVNSKEAITVADKNVEILRYKSDISKLYDSDFTDGSLFKVKDGGQLTITVEDTATLAIDGQNVEVQSIGSGACFSGESGSKLILENKAGITDAFQIKNNVINGGNSCGIFTEGYLKAYKIDISGNKIVGVGNTGYLEGAGIGLYAESSADIESCNIVSNTIVSGSNKDPKGAGIHVWSPKIVNIIDCNISENTIINNISGKLSMGAGIGIRGNISGNVTVKNTNIEGNTATGISGSRAAGIGAYLGNTGGTINFESCTISGNTSDLEQSFGGGIYCTGNGIKNIRKSAESTEQFGCIISNNSAQYGSGMDIYDGFDIIEDCKLSGNKVNMEGSASFPAQFFVEKPAGSKYLIGNTEIESGDSSDYGIWFEGNADTHGTLALSKDSKKFSLSGEKIKVVCSGNKPTSTTPVTFGTNAVETMANYFESGEKKYVVVYRNGNLVLTERECVNLYYSNGTFYFDEACTESTDITRFSEAVEKIRPYNESDTSKGKIYMKSTYSSAANETVNIPASKTVFVQRHSSMTSGQMFYLNRSSTGNLTINATNTNSKLIVDGTGISISDNGAAFYNYGKTLTLNGGTGRNITIQNNGGRFGGAIYSGGSSAALNLTGCVMTGNKASCGGAVYYINGNATLRDCTITGNTASSSGGGLYVYHSNLALQGKMIISDNTSDDLYITGSSYKVNVSGLTAGSNIGVKVEYFPSEGYKTFGTNASYESMLYFTSNMDGYGVTYYNGNLVLAPKLKVTSGISFDDTGYKLRDSSGNGSHVNYTGPIILTASVTSGTEVNFINQTVTDGKTFDITFEDYKHKVKSWYSNIKVTNETICPVTVNMISKGENWIYGHNHPAIKKENGNSVVSRFNLRVVSGSMILGNLYNNLPKVYRNVEFSFLNNPSASFDVNQNTKFNANGTTGAVS